MHIIYSLTTSISERRSIHLAAAYSSDEKAHTVPMPFPTSSPSFFTSAVIYVSIFTSVVIFFLSSSISRLLASSPVLFPFLHSFTGHILQYSLNRAPHFGPAIPACASATTPA